MENIRKKIEILFEDDDLVAISKPAGISVHGDGKKREKQPETVADWVLENYPDTRDVGEHLVINDETVLRPGIVHRIDKDTSGVLLIAKTDESHSYLKSVFMGRKIRKTYHSFLYGKMSDERGIISLPIGRSKNDPRKRAAGRGAKGEMREAETIYKTLLSCPEYSFVEVWPKTGRTHQIRVHFKSINHPVLCDHLYAAGKPALLGFKRLALHASSVLFEDMRGRKREIKAPFPEDFQNAFKEANIKGI